MVYSRRFLLLSLIVLSLTGRDVTAVPDQTGLDKSAIAQKEVSQGALRIVKEDGSIVECPLKHTDVKADIAGFIARVNVTQTFHNPTNEKIEAVYVFPLPHEAAVDDMTMVVGNRRIVGLIKRRAEARQIYERAMMAGQTAALLEQERPNIFTQSVANIEPNQEVQIRISYVDVLRYDLGTYEFSFPMVVGPRFIPGSPSASPPPAPAGLEGKVSPPVPNTDRVPDASRISPPVLRPQFRNGHDISLSINLRAGVPIQNLQAPSHKVQITQGQTDDTRDAASVQLDSEDSIPNKSFVLRYSVVGKKPEMAVLAHNPLTGKADPGYFMLMIQPKEDQRLTQSPPREIVFLVDVSGSMSGQPTAKVIEAMQGMLKLCRQIDTVQVVTFASQANRLFEKPVPVNEQNIRRALMFTEGLRGGGGTHMLQGVKMAIDEPLDKERLRIVVMLTDGYIGNEKEIIEHIGRNCGDRIRFWCIGIGQEPNMFLIDGVARQGGGMGKKLGLNEQAAPMAQEIMTRIQRAQLANVRIDWGKAEVSETYPAKIPELWAGRPVIVFGRYISPPQGRTAVTISGDVEGQAVSWPMAVDLPGQQERNNVLAKVWARQKIEDLMHQTYYAGSEAVEEMVTSISLKHRLMSQYTSFVAVDEKEASNLTEPARPPRRMPIPVPLPEGTQWEGFFGERDLDQAMGFAVPANQPAAAGGLLMERAKSYGGGMRGLARANAVRTRSGQAASAWGRAAGTSAMGIRPAPAAEPATLGLMVKRAELGDRMAFSPQALAPLQSDAMTKAAQEALTAADGIRKECEDFGAQPAHESKLRQARALYGYAYLLDLALQAAYRSNGQVQVAAVAGIEAIDQLFKKSADPLLGKRLTGVIEAQALEEALVGMAGQTGAKLTITPGSIDDARAILNRGNLTVGYLDLRNATVGQALDWLLQPARLSWRIHDGAIIVESDRRSPVRSAWLYDVAMISTPLDEELAGAADKRAAAQQHMDRFLAAVASAIKTGQDSAEVFWWDSGRLIVFGDASVHTAAARALADLANPKAAPKGFADLQKLTTRRAESRKEMAAQLQAARERQHILRLHDAFSWQLLAATAQGDTGSRDAEEALAELKVAWSSPRMEEILKGSASAIAMRSFWAVHEYRAIIPAGSAKWGHPATSAREMVTKSAQAAIAKMEKDPGDTNAFATVVYAALALRDDAQWLPRGMGSLAAVKGEHTTAMRTVALSLLGKREDAQPLRQLIESGVRGDDLTALLALAARRADGETWELFRARQQDLLGSQPLDGCVIVMINHLARPAIRLLAWNPPAAPMAN